MWFCFAEMDSRWRGAMTTSSTLDGHNNRTV